MPKTYDKCMLTINRKELVNKFRLAKNTIVHKIIDEKQAKLMIIQEEITSLQRYIGRSDDIIPHEMKNTIEIVNEQAPQTTQTQAQTKNKFDM